MNIDTVKYWWIVIVLAGVVGIVAIVIADQFLPSLASYAAFLFLVLVGGSFLWAFVQRDIYWAVAPGVGALALAVGVIVSLFIPENNGWVATLILAVSAFVMAEIPNPREEIKVTYAIGLMLLIIGFLLAPLSPLWKVILCVASALFSGYVIWRNRDAMRRISG